MTLVKDFIAALVTDQWKIHLCIPLTRSLCYHIECKFFIFLGTRGGDPLFSYPPSTSSLCVNKSWKNIQKICSWPTKKVRPTMCHIICLWDYNTLQSSVTGDVSDPAEDYSSLWPEQSDFFSPPFSLPFLYSWRHRIILPILEWLQQRHCYSQGAVSPRCNSIHSQLDWPVIYRKSSPSEELSLHTHTRRHTLTLGILSVKLMMC